MNMKRFFYTIIAAIGALCAVACAEKEIAETPYLEVEPSSLDNQTALGKGDAIVISIKSNMEWTIKVDYEGAEKDWLFLEATEGCGDADVFGIILRGSQSDKRNCTITVSAKDGSKSATLAVNQGVFVPEPVVLSFQDVCASAVKDKAVDLLDFSYTEGYVVIDAATFSKIVPGSSGTVIVTDGSTFLRVALPGADALKPGNKVRLDLSGGTILAESTGGYALNLVAPVMSVSESDFTVVPQYIASTSVPNYSYALVRVGGCQAKDEFVGKTWSSGTVVMDMVENEIGTVEVVVPDCLDLSSVAVPENSGTVVGVAIGGKIHPRNALDVASLNEPRGKKYEPVDYRIKSVVALFEFGGASAPFKNVSVEGNRMEFHASEGYSVEGAAISWDGTGAFTWGTENPSVYFTVAGWTLGSGYTYEVPVQEKTYGDLIFCTSAGHGTAADLPWEWEFTWSTDGVNFKPVDIVCGAAAKNTTKENRMTQSANAHADTRTSCFFTIPESEALYPGDRIYLKQVVTSAKGGLTKTIRNNVGFYLASAPKNDPAPQYDNILAAENFDNCYMVQDPVIGAPIDYLTTCGSNNGQYPSRNGWVCTNTKPHLKCMRINGTASVNGLVSSPALSKLTSVSDVTVKFKACLYTDGQRSNNTDPVNRHMTRNISVSVLSGSGEVGEIEWDSDPETDYYNWHNGTVKITGASAETVVGFSGTFKNGQYYIKDIIITK